ncbi:MAG TPA: LacI family DNA-binding transcriptional regulator [Anaerolineales bacterium]|nr:LacI family DNA-binding transcriptional regulator [Anaerolineales bacterium]
MPTSIKDIAKLAGVSHTTVSRALHDSPLISAQTKKRIQAISTQIGYHPSVAARSLKTNRSQVLGVIVSNIADPFFSEILQGIDDVAQSNGYSLFIAAAQHDSIKEHAILQTMREHRVDGVILCSPQLTSEQAKQLQSFEIPIVAINNQGLNDFQYSISHDDVDGSRQACQHLIDLGHVRIAYLGDATSGRTTRDRLIGFQQMMAEHGLSIPPEYIHEATGNSAADGLVGVEHFLSLATRPSAIICYNDMLAMGVLKGVYQADLTVPDDISVTGFDNIIYSDFTQPTLTTIDQPKRFLGAEAARWMFHLLTLNLEALSLPAFSKKLRGLLLIRQSTASPALGRI